MADERKKQNWTIPEFTQQAPASQAEPDTDPEGDGKVAIWRYINNHEDMLMRIFTRLDKLEGVAPAETVGEMTAEQFRLSQSRQLGGALWWTDERAEAYAKQRVEQAEHVLKLSIASNKDFARDNRKLLAKVSDLERERDGMVKELHAAINEPMYAGTRQDWMNRAHAAELKLKDMREALRESEGEEAMFDKWIRDEESQLPNDHDTSWNAWKKRAAIAKVSELDLKKALKHTVSCMDRGCKPCNDLSRRLLADQ